MSKKSDYTGWSPRGIRVPGEVYGKILDFLKKISKKEDFIEEDEYVPVLDSAYQENLSKEFKTWGASDEGHNHKYKKILMQTPRIFVLLCKVASDQNVSESSKAKLAIGISYFILPFDLIPEALIGPVGYIDDLVLSALILKGDRK